MELTVELNVARKTWNFDFAIKSLRLLKMLLALEVFLRDIFERIIAIGDILIDISRSQFVNQIFSTTDIFSKREK